MFSIKTYVLWRTIGNYPSIISSHTHLICFCQTNPRTPWRPNMWLAQSREMWRCFYDPHTLWATSWGNLFMPHTNKKDADQPAHPRSLISAFVVRCLCIIIPLVSISEMSGLYLASVAAQAFLGLTWPQTPKTGFLVTWLTLYRTLDTLVSRFTKSSEHLLSIVLPQIVFFNYLYGNKTWHSLFSLVYSYQQFSTMFNS